MVEDRDGDVAGFDAVERVNEVHEVSRHEAYGNDQKYMSSIQSNPPDQLLSHEDAQYDPNLNTYSKTHI